MISSGQSIPKPPAERTFVFAVTLLAAVALIQIAAVVVAIAPNVQFDRMMVSEAAVETEAERVVASPAPQTTPVPVEVATEVNRLLDEAQTMRDRGDLEQSLEPLAEAGRLVSDEPGIWFQIGMTYRELGRNAEAVPYLQQVVSSPKMAVPAYATILQQTQAVLAELGAAPAGAPGASTAPAAASAPAANNMRDEVGIPIGSVMGIVEARMKDGAPGTKKLQIATKASSTIQIDDPLDVKTMVYFFEQNDSGDVIQTQSPVTSEWLSPPVDWKGGEPELLEVTYPLPGDRGDLAPLQYYGYVVGVYYKGELQDVRPEPASLIDQFPLKFYLTDDAQ